MLSHLKELNANRRRSSEFKLELFVLVREVVENVRSNANDGDPHSEHGNMRSELFQSRGFVGFARKHRRKHLPALN